MDNNVKEISATAAISAEINQIWYKFSYSETRTIKQNEDLVEQRNSLQDDVYLEVEKQINSLIGGV